MELPSSLCQTDTFSCMGCCGHSYGTQKQVRFAIRMNGKEYDGCTDLEKFRKGAEVLRACGVCKAVVERKNRVLCALHPKQHNGKDLRDDVCEKEYMCTAMKYYTQEWSASTKKKFVAFLLSKNVDWYEYSMNMDQDVYVKEFLETG